MRLVLRQTPLRVEKRLWFLAKPVRLWMLRSKRSHCRSDFRMHALDEGSVYVFSVLLDSARLSARTRHLRSRICSCLLAAVSICTSHVPLLLALDFLSFSIMGVGFEGFLACAVSTRVLACCPLFVFGFLLSIRGRSKIKIASPLPSQASRRLC